MTSANYDKVFVQLKAKPAILKKYLKHSAPKEKSCGKSKYKCQRCGRVGAHIQKYGLHLCRHCFRELAFELGFKKYD